MLDSEAYLDPDNFYITNPNLGRSVSQEWLEDELKKELAKDASTRNTFLAKHLNIEIGQNHRNNRWAGTDFWPKRVLKGLTLESLMDQSEVVVVGIDGGGLDDLFGFAVVGRHKETPRLARLVACLVSRRRAGAAQVHRADASGFQAGRRTDHR